MANARRVIRCQSCGAILQTESKSKPGFISRAVIESGVPRLPYCNSCYEKMIALNSSSLDHETDKDILKILKDAVATDSLIVWMVDLFTFNGTLNPDVVKRIKKLDIVVIGSKRDLMPSAATDDMLIRYIDERFADVGINPIRIELIGNEESIDIKEKLNKLGELRKGRDVYLIGELNSGKTTFVNKMLKDYKNNTRWQIKSELYPGTNSNVLEIPLTNSSFFYELPDLSNNTSVFSRVEASVQRTITPKKEVALSRKFIGAGSSIVVGNLACFSIIRGHHTSVRVFAGEKVEFKVIDTNKIDDFLANNLKKKTLKPVSERYTSFRDYDMFEYDLESDDLRHDIAVEGLCWFSIKGKGQTVRILLPKGVAVKESLSKIR